MHFFRLCLVAVSCSIATGPLVSGCKSAPAAGVVTTGETFAEMASIKGSVSVTPKDESKRAPYPRERLAEGEAISIGVGGLAWIRRDAGAVWLVEGPAELVMHDASVNLTKGRAFVSGEDGPPVEVDTPRGALELSDARASVDVRDDGTTDVYVLRGAARAGASDRAVAGEELTWKSDGKITRTSAVAWDDWTGGLATADPEAEPAPFGLGTVGARPPGDQGKPRFSLVVERLDVRVTVDHDYAITEVDQTFINPSSDTVEGIFSFRTPPGAVLSKFGVDRDGTLVWGKVKEAAAAKAQYESNVYQGSTEDPALLSWSAPGVYSARLYPIEAGAKRRVVTRYGEWLSRQGPKSDRRVYVYPMAAEGARASLPRIEELRVTLDLTRAGASRVRAGMGGKKDGNQVTIQAFDFVPRADLAVELFDDGQKDPVAYRAPHALTAEDIPMNAAADFASKVSSEEPDYLLVPLRSAPPADSAAGANGGSGVDLAIVVDTSAATETGALAIARSLTSALLAHLGPDDRAALWAGDASLRPVFDGSGSLAMVDATKRRAWLAGLAAIDRGGATDIGALLTEAASKLDPKRRGAVIYIGDGLPSVGEVSPKALRERLARLPDGTRVLAAGIGSRANIALLDSITRGAPVEPVGDAYGAARAALRLLESAQKPAWIGATVDLGPGVERVLPRALPPIGSDESVLVVGRITGKPPTEVSLTGGGQTTKSDLKIVALADSGDLRRRWGQGRMEELLGEGAGRASLVDIARRFGLVSPYTSLYVPTAREAAQADTASNDDLAESRAAAIERRKRWRPWSHGFATRDEASVVAENADNKEGGTGTRAKGEEGSMGNPRESSRNTRYAVRGPAGDAPQSAVAASPPAAQPNGAPNARAQAMHEAQEFGMIGTLSAASAAPPSTPAATATTGMNAPSAVWGAQIADSSAKLSAGEGGGGSGNGIGLSGIGFGGGGGKLGGAHQTKGIAIGAGDVKVNGNLPREVISRIVRQNFGRFRLCYENGARNNPSLAGHVAIKFVIDRSGAVATAQDGGSDLPDAAVIACIVRGFGNLSFPQPEGGIAVVTYPLVFSGDGAAQNVSPTPAVVAVKLGPIAVIGHTARPCGAAADLPLADRRVLWSERLSTAGNAQGALTMYRQALESCEAPTWRERTTLLLLMVQSLHTVTERVALWKALIATPAAETIYRAIIVRVQTVAELHELHQALGLASVDPDLLAGMVAKAKTPQDKLSVLRAAALKWPDDLELALRVLDQYEDVGDDGGGRAWARRLRRRADATAHVWTSVGEHYLRLAARESGADAERDRIEGRRTFGELVEFAPDDPAARRRLGDLLRAHGWYEEAFRQYLTLQDLTPDDPSVPLLLADATQGMGRIEEAVGWAEKAAAAGSPDGASTLSRSSRATASAFLAWARADALRAGKKEDADKLLARAKRLAATSANGGSATQEQNVRVIVTWSHPELHPSLWTSTLGAPMPSPDNFPLFGVAEAKINSGPVKVELRLDPEDAARAARLHLTAVVTAITGEGTANEKIARTEITFGTVAQPLDRQAVTLDGDSLRVGAP